MDKRKQMIQRMAGFLIVFMVGFVVVSNVLTTTVQGETINDSVTFSALGGTFSSTNLTPDCGDTYAGQFSFEARLTNTSDNPITNLVVKVVKLTNGNVLQNADGGADGEWALLTIPEIDNYSDGELGVDEYVDVYFNICLAEWASFSFYVDVLDSEFTLSSIAILNGELLEDYKCEEKDDATKAEKSIPLSWDNVPSAAESLAIIMHHYPFPDTQPTLVNSYLLLWDIASTVTEIPHGEGDDGPWYMGANKDGAGVSYSSPCSASPGTHEYTITLYALSETPSSLPSESTVAVTYDVLKAAIETVTIIDTATLTFDDVTE